MSQTGILQQFWIRSSRESTKLYLLVKTLKTGSQKIQDFPHFVIWELGFFFAQSFRELSLTKILAIAVTTWKFSKKRQGYRIEHTVYSFHWNNFAKCRSLIWILLLFYACFSATQYDHRRHWPPVFKAVVAALADSELFDKGNQLQKKSLLLGGSACLHGEGLVVVCFHGANFRSRSWVLFNILQPNIVFSTEVQEIEGNLKLFVGKVTPYNRKMNYTFKVGASSIKWFFKDTMRFCKSISVNQIQKVAFKCNM